MSEGEQEQGSNSENDPGFHFLATFEKSERQG